MLFKCKYASTCPFSSGDNKSNLLTVKMMAPAFVSDELKLRERCIQNIPTALFRLILTVVNSKIFSLLENEIPDVICPTNRRKRI